MNSEAAAVEFRKVSYWYPDSAKPVFENLNLNIKKGEFLLVVGSSGAGKSTFCRCVNGLIPHYSGGLFGGEVVVCGNSTLGCSPEKIARYAGMVFQDPESQLVSSSVEDELVFGLENLGLDEAEIEKRVSGVVEELGIQNLLGWKTRRLSGGEKQKTVLASVLAMEPEVLVLDEPTSQLDSEASSDLLNLLKKINRDLDLTVILVEHKFNLVLDYVDRVFDLDQKKAISRKELAVKIGKEKTTSRGHQPKNNFQAKKPLIEVAGLHYAYPESTEEALKGVNLRIHEGESIAITGRNGAGKTTLVKHFNGLLKPAMGEVFVSGTSTKNTATEEIAKTVGYLPQNPNDYLFSDTVEDELRFTLKSLKIKADERKISEILDYFGLIAYRHSYPRDLSGGERQRVALAAILVANPKAIVLDEPTRGIDSESRRRLAELIKGLSVQGKTIILVTHDSDLVSETAERIVRIEDGKIEYDKKQA